MFLDIRLKTMDSDIEIKILTQVDLSNKKND